MRSKALRYLCILMLVILLPQTSAQLFPPTYSIESTFPGDSIVIGCGRTSFTGNLPGVNISEIIDVSSIDLPKEIDNYSNIDDLFHLSIVETLHGFPLFARTVITGVDIAALLSKSVFENPIQTPQDMQQFLNQIEQYQQVSIIIDQGMAFFGTDGSKLNVQSEFDFALSGFFEIPFESNVTIEVAAILSRSDHLMSYSKNTSLIFPFLNSTRIFIANSNNETIRTVLGSDHFLLLNHSMLRITEKSPVHLFPFASEEENSEAILSISSADDEDVTIAELISEVSTVSSLNDEMSLPLNVSNDSMISDVIKSVSSILNGGLLCANMSKSLLIDGDRQSVSFFTFLHGDYFTIQKNTSESPVRKITGQASVLFIDNHFYTVDGKDNEYGLFFPILPIIFWSAAIICFVLWKWYLLPKEDSSIDKKTSYILLSLRLATIIVIFVLIDVTINAQIRISFFSLIFSNLFSLVTLGLLIFQLIVWVLGYLSCAFPLQYVLHSLFRFTPLNEFGKTPAKSIGLLGIWFFSILYTILLLNIALFFLSSFLPTMPIG